MVLANSWFWLVALIVWIVGVGAISSWLMGKTWLHNHGKLYRWQIWLFRVNGVAFSLVGFVVGFQVGNKLTLSQTCEGLAVFGCVGESLTNMLIGSLLGTVVGATVGVVGIASVMRLLKFD